jgi:PAS domain S-box-containing protein
MVNVLAQGSALLEIAAKRNFTAADINATAYLNIMQSVPLICSIIGQVVNDLMSYNQAYLHSLNSSYAAVGYCFAGFGVLCYLVFVIIEVRWILGNEERVYTCLTYIPRNVASQIAENLRVHKKDTEETLTTQTGAETNKQDDNIMKTFMAGGSSGFRGISDELLVIFLNILVMGTYLIIMLFLTRSVVNHSRDLTLSAPQIVYVLGSWGQAIAALTDVLQMYWLGTKYQNPMVNKDLLTERFNDDLKAMNQMYRTVRFGLSDVGVPPYDGYEQASDNAQSEIDCAHSLVIPYSFDEAMACYTPETIYEVFGAVLQSQVDVFRQNRSQSVIIWDIRVQKMWSLSIYPCLELLVHPMFLTIVHNIRQDYRNSLRRRYPLYIAMIILAFVMMVIIIINIRSMAVHMHRVLKLLLNCPVPSILQNPRAMAILSGNFSTQKRDDLSKKAAFFRQVVQQIPDAIITVIADTMIVEHMNISSERLFGEDLVGKSLPDFMRQKFEGNVDCLFTVGLERKEKTETLVYKKDPDNMFDLETRVLPINNTFVFICRDITQTVRYNTLIAFDKSKSDILLKSILPPPLVPHVQAGEKNISFAVSSATIVFVDIVSFTPWCGATPASKVMMTLNNLYKKFDVNCNRQSTMTRIKCIGDCYMAAGGVFSEVNQPAEHAKQVVSFGLDSLDSIQELDQEQNEELQIRVGINTGGPIVAGVLGGGVGKPTFEILGRSINMAQQMERHGVPMHVHVSRAVYELIYGAQFIVKERGQIEVNAGKVVTYLVTGRTNTN